jgi:hypothetical protein
VRRRAASGYEIGVDLLLSGSDAFGNLADALAAEYDRRHDAGDRPEVLDWVLRMAEFAGWWCGRLEAEADHVAGFGRGADSAMSGGMPSAADSGPGIRGEQGDDGGRCHRRRRQPPR